MKKMDNKNLVMICFFFGYFSILGQGLMEEKVNTSRQDTLRGSITEERIYQWIKHSWI